jgi:hypothetical protein
LSAKRADFVVLSSRYRLDAVHTVVNPIFAAPPKLFEMRPYKVSSLRFEVRQNAAKKCIDRSYIKAGEFEGRKCGLLPDWIGSAGGSERPFRRRDTGIDFSIRLEGTKRIDAKRPASCGGDCGIPLPECVIVLLDASDMPLQRVIKSDTLRT